MTDAEPTTPPPSTPDANGPTTTPAGSAHDTQAVATRIRPMTVVWGAILIVTGVLFVAWALGARFDVGLLSAVILALAGVALIVTAVLGGLRRQS